MMVKVEMTDIAVLINFLMKTLNYSQTLILYFFAPESINQKPLIVKYFKAKFVQDGIFSTLQLFA